MEREVFGGESLVVPVGQNFPTCQARCGIITKNHLNDKDEAFAWLLSGDNCPSLF